MISALCFVKVAPGKVNQVGEALAAIPGVRTVYSVTGSVDLVTVIEVPGHEGVADVVGSFTAAADGKIGRAHV